MKKIFLDTNVILDYYLDREGFSDEAERIFTYGKYTFAIYIFFVF